MTLSSNKHPERLYLSPQCGHVTLLCGFLVLTAVNWHEYPMPFSWFEPLCDLMFTKLAWLRSPYWCDTSTTAVVVGDSTCPRAIPLAMSAMKKERLGFHNFYAWFSSVSPISIGIGLRSAALGPGEAPLIKNRENLWRYKRYHKKKNTTLLHFERLKQATLVFFLHKHF